MVFDRNEQILYLFE